MITKDIHLKKVELNHNIALSKVNNSLTVSCEVEEKILSDVIENNSRSIKCESCFNCREENGIFLMEIVIGLGIQFEGAQANEVIKKEIEGGFQMALDKAKFIGTFLLNEAIHMPICFSFNRADAIKEK